MKSPFKFLDAYTLEDKGQFFGRDAETEALYKMVFKTPLLLVYGLSGTGKTSLVQCGLASRFDGPDWLPLFIRRQSDINRSLRTTLQKVSGATSTGATLPEMARLAYRHYLRPVYLIFDQFEEVFIIGSENEQQQLAQSLKTLLAAELPCTILLIIREEYLGRLYAFEKAIPSLFDFRLRVEPMNAAKVKTILTSSFQQFNITLEQPESKSLQLIIDNISSGKSGIQLPYLQVYLDMLYREDYARAFGKQQRREELPPLEFTRQEIKTFGSIENVLEKFLRQQETAIQQMLSEQYPAFPAGAVHTILDAFVTEEGTKRPVGFQRRDTDKQILLESPMLRWLPPVETAALSRCLELLEQSRLIRFSDDNMELAHDSLAALIDEQRTDEQRQLNEVRRRIQNNYLDHQQTGEYLSRKQLHAYEDYLPHLTLEPAAQQYIRDSEAHAERMEAREQRRQRELDLVRQRLETEKKAARRQRFFTIITSVAAAIALALGAWALHQRNQTEIARQNEAREAFRTQLANAHSMKSQGLYQDAIELLQGAAKFAAFPEQGPQQDTLTSLLSQYRQAGELAALADSLAQQDSTLLAALRLYEEAYGISPDKLLQTKIEQAQGAIAQKYTDYRARAANLLEYGGCTYAMPMLEKLLQLRPNDPWAKQRARRCGSRI